MHGIVKYHIQYLCRRHSKAIHSISIDGRKMARSALHSCTAHGPFSADVFICGILNTIHGLASCVVLQFNDLCYPVIPIMILGSGHYYSRRHVWIALFSICPGIVPVLPLIRMYRSWVGTTWHGPTGGEPARFLRDLFLLLLIGSGPSSIHLSTWYDGIPRDGRSEEVGCILDRSSNRFCVEDDLECL